MSDPNGNGHKLKAITESVGLTLSTRLAVWFVTLVALPFGLWLGNRVVASMDTMASAVQSINERLVRVETKLEYLQDQR